MPQLSIALGPDPLTITDGSLTSPEVADFSDAALALAAISGASLPTGTIADLPVDPLQFELRSSTALKWKFAFPEGASLAVSMEPTIASSLTIARRSPVFPASNETPPDLGTDDDLPLPPPAHPDSNPAKAYVSIRLVVLLDTTGSAAWTHGLVGLKVQAGTGQRFLLAYHHAVDPNATLAVAISEAFQNFTFPYLPEQASKLRPDCFLEWEHLSRLDLGFEASVGVAAALLGARGSSELSRLLSADLGKAVLQYRPVLSSGTTFEVDYTHEDAFRSVLTVRQNQQRQLFIYRMSRDKLSIGLNVTSLIQVTNSPQIADRLTTAASESLSALLTAGDPAHHQTDFLSSVGSGVLKMVAGTSASDITQRINNFFSALSIGVSVGRYRVGERQALVAYNFDARDSTALSLALSGTLRDAVVSNRLTVLPGSLVSDSISQRSSVKLMLVGVGQASNTNEFARASQFVYEGSGVFSLRYSADRRSISEVFGQGKQIDVLFTARAQAFADQHIQLPDIRLRITLTDTNNPDAAKRTASALALLLDGKTDLDVARLMRDAISANPHLTTELVCSIAPSAFRKLAFTQFEKTNRPKQLPQASDAANYEAFLNACQKLLPAYLYSLFPYGADTFADWAQFNIALNDRPDAMLDEESRPNRRSTASTGSNWPEFGRLAGVNDQAKRAMIHAFFSAAASFMNACEDLQVLANELDQAKTEDAFKQLSKDMEILAGKEVPGSFPLFFGKPALVALISQMNPSVFKIDGPVSDDHITDSFRVRLDIL